MKRSLDWDLLLWIQSKNNRHSSAGGSGRIDLNDRIEIDPVPVLWARDSDLILILAATGSQWGVISRGVLTPDMPSFSVQRCPGRKRASFCSYNVPQFWGVFFPAGQCSMPHSQVSEGVDERPPEQDPVMASPIPRPESHWKPLEYDQWEDGWSQAELLKCMRQEWHKVTQRQCERACQDTWKLWL